MDNQERKCHLEGADSDCGTRSKRCGDIEIKEGLKPLIV